MIKSSNETLAAKKKELEGRIERLRDMKKDLLDTKGPDCGVGSSFWGKPDPTECDKIDDKLIPLKRELNLVTAKL